MPRNDQVTRQWHLLRRLESPGGATLQELVHALPDDFPKNPRTVRRGLEALEAVGFPQETSSMKDGRLKMTLKVADTTELVGWILSFGGQVRVIRPEFLIKRVRDEAKKILGSKV